jgi:hypothetical protein
VSTTHFKGVRKIVESREWSKQDIDTLVEQLRGERDAGQRILLCGVYGARLSEGIDYNGGILDAGGVYWHSKRTTIRSIERSEKVCR